MLNRLQAVFASLHAHEVQYVVIGGVAAVLHGVPRATFDLNVLIEPSAENAKRLLDALLEAQMGTAALVTPEEVLSEEITIFNDHVRIDVQTSTPGLEFAAAWRQRETMNYKGHVFYVACREELIASKRAAGHSVDLEDVRILECAAEGEAT